MTSYDIEDLKNKRFGHIDQGRDNDQFVIRARTLLEGETLPKYWQYRNLEYFLEKYGDRGMVQWASTANYHLLILNGHRVFRMWTADGTSQSVLVDILPHIGEQYGPVEDIPKGSLTKCKPFTVRIRLSSLEDVDRLTSIVRTIYGI